jgi:hypothetical protein
MDGKIYLESGTKPSHTFRKSVCGTKYFAGVRQTYSAAERLGFTQRSAQIHRTRPRGLITRSSSAEQRGVGIHDVLHKFRVRDSIKNRVSQKRTQESPRSAPCNSKIN